MGEPYLWRTANMSRRTCVVVKQMQSNPTSMSTSAGSLQRDAFSDLCVSHCGRWLEVIFRPHFFNKRLTPYTAFLAWHIVLVMVEFSVFACALPIFVCRDLIFLFEKFLWARNLQIQVLIFTLKFVIIIHSSTIYIRHMRCNHLGRTINIDWFFFILSS